MGGRELLLHKYKLDTENPDRDLHTLQFQFKPFLRYGMQFD